MRKQMEELDQTNKLLMENERRLKRAQALAHVGNWELNLDDKTVWASEEAFNLYGIKMKSHVVPLKLVQQVVHVEDRRKLDKALDRLIKGEADYNVNFRVISINNSEIRYMHSVAEVEYDSSGKPIRISGVIQDVTASVHTELDLYGKNRELTTLYEELAGSEEELRKQLQTINHMAYYDLITNLPNRILALDRLETAISKATKNGTKVMIVFLDLDNFKIVNDTLGHETGDELLFETAKRLITCIDENNTVARLGGDAFCFLIGDAKQQEGIVALLERVKLSFAEPFRINDHIINLTASIGISKFPEDGDSAGEIVKSAETAMYKAKEIGKNNYQFFNIKMRKDLLRKTDISGLLRNAINNNEFVLHYQPQYTVKTGQLRGFEALLRWNSSEMGFLTPMEFIPIAEETGLIIQIGEWVLNTACHTCKRFETLYGCNLVMAVNISPIQLRQKNFHKMVIKALKATGLKSRNLELEVTEGIFIDSYDSIVDKLRVLKELGVKTALDDFGTGYSSLSYLKRLPVNLLKIDKSFVQEIDFLNLDNEFTASIIALVNKLNIKTIAEGVETLNQLNYLVSAKCDYLQGYFLGKPGPEDLIGGIIERGCFKELLDLSK